jgi:Gpi18-like mannosyltransferase
MYQWLGGTALGANKWVGIGLAALAMALAGGLLLLCKTGMRTNVALHLALLCVLAVPFLLPKMHERYFFLADVISIVYAFSFPRAFLIPIVMQLVSLLSYAPYLTGAEPVRLAYVAVAVLGITLVAAVRFVGSVRSEGFIALPLLARKSAA